jgi:hypothetical protein
MSAQDRLEPCVDGSTVDMLGVMNFLPSPALHLFERGAGIVVPALVVPVDPARLVGSPGELTDVIGKFAKASFAFT